MRAVGAGDAAMMLMLPAGRQRRGASELFLASSMRETQETGDDLDVNGTISLRSSPNLIGKRELAIKG